ncbi:ATP-dependent RNA helicase dbp6 [Dimargaris verticillata]|uniref:ATP-dependent RNA helicase n=1 Tax=Dimargaris verticillata TaxID=2761393 RepID=A0A9W8B450_9FUNG|nr:ATP-dependent RNA helicase dbp6 [Dimargaris verticillata]
MASGIPQWLAHPQVVPQSTTTELTASGVVLSDDALAKCQALGIEKFFAVQAAVMPTLLLPAVHSLTRHTLRDVCVSAPTGSGKTLAYVIPIVEKLRLRVVVRLRALIVLPTRDLVYQVKATLDHFCADTNLRVAAITGQTPFPQEQDELCGLSGSQPLVGGRSAVDIIVCTPGRLIDHLAGTANFTLQHLEFLVIDEADRLLGQNYQDWLVKVLDATESSSSPMLSQPTESSQVTRNAFGMPVHDALSHPARTVANPWLFTRPPPRMQKLLFSATLTTDPAQIASLRLVDPHYISVRDTEMPTPLAGEAAATMDEQYTLPPTLTQHLLTVTAEEKPLLVLYLLHTRAIRSALCFTRSVETAHRLYQLVALINQLLTERLVAPDAALSPTAMDLEPSSDSATNGQMPRKLVIGEYSSDLSQKQRTKLLTQFRNGDLQLLVCSDVIARGIDVDTVDAVINYDAPSHPRNYVHRVGRTARAGRPGDAYTLVELADSRKFKKMLKMAGFWDTVNQFQYEPTDLDSYQDAYQSALETLRKIYKS